MVAAATWFAGAGSALPRDQLDASGRFHVRWWTADDGFPETPLVGAAFAADGTLVCSSRSRLVKFNGATIEPYPQRVTDALHAAIGDFWSIGFDGDGCLWVQGRQAVARLRRPPELADDPAAAWDVHRLPEAVLMGLTFDPDGRPVCVGPDVVFAFDGAGFERLPAVPPATQTASWRHGRIAPRTGDLWLWSGNGRPDIFCLPRPLVGGRRSELVDMQAADPLAIVTIGFGPSGTWALLPDGVALLGDAGWRRIEPTLPAAESRVRGKITESADGTLWVASHDGLLAIRDGRIVTAIEGLPGFSHFTHALVADEAGGVWAACAGGLLAVRRTAVAFEPLATCCAVFERPDGGLLVGTPGGVLLREPAASAEQSPRLVAALPRAAVPTAILETGDGRIWVGTQDTFVLRVEGSRVTPVTKPAAEPSRELRSIQALACDGCGRVWVAASNGLAVHDAATDEFTTVAGYGEPTPLRIVGLAAEPDNTLLVAALGRGIDRLSEDGRLVARLLPAARMPGQRSVVFHRDARGTLWAGGDRGLVRIAGRGHACAVTTATGLVDDAVRQIWDDSDGRLWVAVRDGRLQGLRLDDLEALAAGRRAVVRGVVIHASSGLGGAECVGRVARAGSATAGGHTVIPFDTGLAWFDAAAQTTARERVRPPLVTATNDRPAGHVRFAFMSPGMHIDGEPLHQTRLRGIDADWSAPSPATQRDYRLLQPGSYDFDVRRLDGETDAEFPQTSLTIQVPLPWWREPWAVASLLVGVVAGAMLAARWLTAVRSRRRIAELERQHERDRERSRIARDIHDTLGAGLTRMALMSENARRHAPEALGVRLDAIYRDAHGLARAVDEIVWAVNPVNDTLAEFVSFTVQDVEDFARAGELELRLDVPTELPNVPLESTLRHHVCLAVRELAQNVLRHARAATLGLAIRIDGDRLEVVVEDDGRGFDPERPRADEQDGLHNIRQRIHELGGRVAVESTHGRGTKVTFSVPLGPMRREEEPHHAWG